MDISKVEKMIGTLMLSCILVGFLSNGLLLRFLPDPEASFFWPAIILVLVVTSAFIQIKHIRIALKNR